MRLIVGMLAFGFGYALLYYGIGMYQQYDPSNPDMTSGVPLSVLLGFNNTWSSVGENPSATSNYAKPPFRGWTS